MYLTVSKPRNRFELLNSGFDRFFEDLLDGASLPSTEYGWSPRVDVAEHDDDYVVSLDLPGMEKDQIDVKFEDGVLTVSGERKIERQEGTGNGRYVERFHGKFSRSVTLPKNIKASDIQANYQKGVLEITVPKAEEMKPKQIEVKIG
jgi:HSP20 family protein